jgi:16S rRNA (cytosine967-C5)-methyltransferase
LKAAALNYKELSDTCLSLPNTSRVDELINLDKEAVVQDHSSQRIAEFLELLKGKTGIKIWDCCAASGGKSILAKDVLGDIKLTVSDIRDSILINLKKRFAEAGISSYHSFVTDLSKPLPKNATGQYDLIIADVPCSGSGTWSRTPEQLHFYSSSKTTGYAALQKKIATTVMSQLKPGGYLLYITCSVFKQENEEAVSFLKEKFHLQVVKMEFLKGYELKADSMFAALLQLPL